MGEGDRPSGIGPAELRAEYAPYDLVDEERRPRRILIGGALEAVALIVAAVAALGVDVVPIGREEGPILRMPPQAPMLQLPYEEYDTPRCRRVGPPKALYGLLPRFGAGQRRREMRRGLLDALTSA